jgi:hypothetical protein
MTDFVPEPKMFAGAHTGLFFSTGGSKTPQRNEAEEACGKIVCLGD